MRIACTSSAWGVTGARRTCQGLQAAYGLHGPSSPMPPVQPDPFLELSGQRRRSVLNEEVRYQPTLMLRVAVVVPMVGHVDPAVQILQETLLLAGSLS